MLIAFGAAVMLAKLAAASPLRRKPMHRASAPALIAVTMRLAAAGPMAQSA
jgi:hypothetical protein